MSAFKHNYASNFDDDDDLAPLFTPEQEEKWSLFAYIALLTFLIVFLVLFFSIRF